MIVQPIDYLLIVWFALAAVTTLYVAWDQFRNNPEPGIIAFMLMNSGKNKRARYMADTVNVGPGQRYDVIWKARLHGKWLFHCHIPHHTTNNNVEQNGGGGLMMIFQVEP